MPKSVDTCSYLLYNTDMKQLLDLLQDISDNGEESDDRTGVGTLRVFGRSMRFDLRKGFPATTTKKLAFKAVTSELLWFLEGSDSERRLAEILHGTRDPEKKTIWSPNANSDYWKPKAMFTGDLGRVYGTQWRTWNTGRNRWIHSNEQVPVQLDQIDELIKGIKKDPAGRRHIVSAWRPDEFEQMALPPCHVMFQMFVSKGKLSCQMYQRSADTFLGIPFNIASYALLTHMIAQVCDLEVGELIIVLGDAHIYKNHMDQVKEMLQREPMPLATLKLNPDVKDINDFSMADVELIDYVSHAALTGPMAV